MPAEKVKKHLIDSWNLTDADASSKEASHLTKCNYDLWLGQVHIKCMDIQPSSSSLVTLEYAIVEWMGRVYVYNQILVSGMMIVFPIDKEV